jgi:soluble lytic murein transglycosylase-like protein
MQVQPATATAYVSFSDPSELLDPALNIEAGSGFLAFLISRYGEAGGIQAYNLGETKFRKGLTSPSYLGKVQDALNQLTVEV